MQGSVARGPLDLHHLRRRCDLRRHSARLNHSTWHRSESRASDKTARLVRRARGRDASLAGRALPPPALPGVRSFGILYLEGRAYL